MSEERDMQRIPKTIMHKVFFYTFCLGILLLSSVSLINAAPCATLYEDKNYGGTWQHFFSAPYADFRNLPGPGGNFNDEASSISVCAGTRATVYEHIDYAGNYIYTFLSDFANFQNLSGPGGNFNDEASSIRVCSVDEGGGCNPDACGNFTGAIQCDGSCLVTTNACDYSLSNAGSISVQQGNSVDNTITATLISGTVQNVTLGASALPSGAGASFTNNPCVPTCSSTMTINVLASTPPDTYLIVVDGSPLGKTTSFNLGVVALTPPMTLTATPSCSPTPRVNLSWTSGPADTTGYNVNVCPTGASCPILIDGVTPPTTSYTDTGTMQNFPGSNLTYDIQGFRPGETFGSNAVTIPWSEVACVATLTVTKSGSGSGSVSSSPAGISCGSDCTEDYTDGTSVTLTASPASGSSFSGWSGACSGTESCKVTMDDEKSVNAEFRAAASEADLTADKTNLLVGEKTTLRWCGSNSHTCAGATSCRVELANEQAVSTACAGTYDTGALNTAGLHKYYLKNQGPGGDTSDKVEILVRLQPPRFKEIAP